MGFKCGIVGLPNVGKSTLFNALTRTAAAQAANYPFCTIEPNTGEVAVPDPRLQKIAAIAKSKEIIPTRISFVDIAGLVRGASKGEGLGNQFLANIREVDAIVHVLRCFEDDDITHVEGRIDPVADAETVETELMLADLESLERRIVQIRKRASGKDKEALDRAADHGSRRWSCCRTASRRASCCKGIAAEDLAILQGLNLLTVASGALCLQRRRGRRRNRQRAYARPSRRWPRHRAPARVVISAAIEAEVAQLPDEEAKEFLADARARGARPRQADPRRLRPAPPDHLFHRRPEGDARLDRRTRAPRRRRRPASSTPTSNAASSAPRPSPTTTSSTLGGEVAAKEAGKARDEGKEYVVQDGDVMLFKFNT